MDNNFNIIFFGDSLTVGYGVSKENSWVYKLTEKLHFHSLNKACNGDTTPSMISRYYTDVLMYSPSKIFIMAGTNDLLLGRSVNSIIENIDLMIKDAININSKIIIGIPPKIIGQMASKIFAPSSFYDYAESELKILREQLIDLCNRYNIKFIDFYTLTINQDERIYLDGLHLNSLGHELMYKEAMNSIDFNI
ncbi:GDSL-type esterase/lipase family protein [Clostridium saccharobutylicum]|uniref:Arylesterase n=1 Tax=Clostridium saccharobutylicum TaxID=169679 RepID=A0A1S8N6M1_CLOSA|nr:GDSL-type esterase/lipase family protein [Clostridium saccharobutylicum]OOM12043.1 arylesterase precursor [Clostridium saccharobutylicum]